MEGKQTPMPTWLCRVFACVVHIDATMFVSCNDKHKKISPTEISHCVDRKNTWRGPAVGICVKYANPEIINQLVPFRFLVSTNSSITELLDVPRARARKNSAVVPEDGSVSMGNDEIAAWRGVLP